MFQLKKDQDFYTFIKKKKINIQSNFINTKKLIETQIFPKLTTKMFQSFFLSTRNYLLFDFIKKIKVIERKKMVYSILLGLKVNKKF